MQYPLTQKRRVGCYIPVRVVEGCIVVCFVPFRRSSPKGLVGIVHTVCVVLDLNSVSWFSFLSHVLRLRRCFSLVRCWLVVGDGNPEVTRAHVLHLPPPSSYLVKNPQKLFWRKVGYHVACHKRAEVLHRRHQYYIPLSGK